MAGYGIWAAFAVLWSILLYWDSHVISYLAAKIMVHVIFKGLRSRSPSPITRRPKCCVKIYRASQLVARLLLRWALKLHDLLGTPSASL